MNGNGMKKRWISLYVENQVGVLSKISGLFSGKSYNLDSLTVGTTEDPTVSRMTIATVSDNETFEQIKKQLNRMVTAYLDFAENMTLRHIPLTMQDWEKRLNSFIEMFDYGILQDAGKVSAEIAKLHAETEFEKYRVIQDSLFMSDFDRYMLELEESAKK